MELPGVVALKRLEDERNIKQYIKEKGVRRVVIVGMGYIALEMSEAFRANVGPFIDGCQSVD